MRAVHYLFLALVLGLAGCGESEELAEGNRGGQFDFPSGSRWEQSKFDTVRRSCADRGQSKGGDYQKWFSFCGCVYGQASTRWEFTDFSQNFQTYYEQMVDDKTIGNCLTQSGLTQ